jgi:hypothetical protein
MNVGFPPFTIGSVIAIVVLILAVVLLVIGRLPWEVAGLLGALAVARLT